MTACLRHAQGSGIPSKYLGSANNPTTGAHKANLSTAVRALGTEFAADELNHVILLRTALGSAAIDKPAVPFMRRLMHKAPNLASGMTFAFGSPNMQV